MAMVCINGVSECEGCMKCYKENQIGNCEQCSEPIFEGETYFDFDGELVHEGCLKDWTEQFIKK